MDKISQEATLAYKQGLMTILTNFCPCQNHHWLKFFRIASVLFLFRPSESYADFWKYVEAETLLTWGLKTCQRRNRISSNLQLARLWLSMVLLFSSSSLRIGEYLLYESDLQCKFVWGPPWVDHTSRCLIPKFASRVRIYCFQCFGSDFWFHLRRICGK